MAVFALRLGNDRYLPLLDLERPVRVTRLFTTLADGQRKAIFHFCFRERADLAWQPVGRIEWDQLPASRAGEPTLELRLIPGRAGSLLLRLRERTLGAARSYSLLLPVVPRERLPEASRQVPQVSVCSESSLLKGSPSPPLPGRPPEVRPKTHSPPGRPVAADRRNRRRRVAIGLAAAAVLLLAIGAVLVMRLIPLRETHTIGVQATEFAPRIPPALAVQPKGIGASADGVSGLGSSEPASATEPAAPPRKPASATEPASPPRSPAPAAQGARPKGAPEPLSYRVKWGDTLWRITKHYYGNPDLYS